MFNEKQHINNIREKLVCNSFSEELYQHMVIMGFSTYKLASLTDISHTSIKRYLNGSPPRKGYALRLCIALNLSREESFELLDTAGLILSDKTNKDILYKYIIDNIDFRKATVTDINILIDSVICENKFTRKIDEIELI